MAYYAAERISRFAGKSLKDGKTRVASIRFCGGNI